MLQQFHTAVCVRGGGLGGGVREGEREGWGEEAKVLPTMPME